MSNLKELYIAFCHNFSSQPARQKVHLNHCFTVVFFITIILCLSAIIETESNKWFAKAMRINEKAKSFKSYRLYRISEFT